MPYYELIIKGSNSTEMNSIEFSYNIGCARVEIPNLQIFFVIEQNAQSVMASRNEHGTKNGRLSYPVAQYRIEHSMAFDHL